MPEQSSEENIQVYLDSAKKYFEQENYDMAQDDFNRALSIAEKEYGEQSKEVGDLYITIAQVIYQH